MPPEDVPERTVLQPVYSLCQLCYEVYDGANLCPLLPLDPSRNYSRRCKVCNVALRDEERLIVDVDEYRNKTSEPSRWQRRYRRALQLLTREQYSEFWNMVSRQRNADPGALRGIDWDELHGLNPVPLHIGSSGDAGECLMFIGGHLVHMDAGSTWILTGRSDVGFWPNQLHILPLGEGSLSTVTITKLGFPNEWWEPPTGKPGLPAELFGYPPNSKCPRLKFGFNDGYQLYEVNLISSVDISLVVFLTGTFRL